MRVRIEKPPLCWGIHNAAHRHTVFDECNIHGEITAPLYKFFCAIKRVDNDETISLVQVRARLFFGDNQNAGKGLGLTFGD